MPKSKIRKLDETKCREHISYLRRENWMLIEEVAELIKDMAALNQKHLELAEKYGAFTDKYAKLSTLYRQTMEMFTSDGPDYKFPNPSPQ
jgi:hypothetical protein